MHADEEMERRRSDVQIGADLSALSVEDLDQRVVALEAEIVRLKQARAAKHEHIQAAATIFGTPVNRP
jgi:uncharacterized small protein (DUF1192 family)